MRDTLLLIDGNPLIYRSFYGNSEDEGFRSDGLPTGAVSGFLSRLWDLLRDDLKEYRFTHAAAIFDAPGGNWRHKILNTYKGNREEQPVDLQCQLHMAKKFVPLFGLKMVQQRGFEADDLIATYVQINDLTGGDTVIVSSDKDLSCLVKPGTIIYSPIEKDRAKRWIKSDAVIKRFGVPPHLVPEVQALSGDAIDNVPGVSKCGPVTAAAMILAHGSVEGVIAAAEAGTLVAPRRKSICQDILAVKEDLRRWRRVVGLDSYVRVAVPLADLAMSKVDAYELVASLKALEISSLTKWVAWKYSLRVEEIPPSPDMMRLSSEMMEWRAP